MPPLQAEVNCPIQRLAPPWTCAHMATMLPMLLFHILNFFISMVSIFPSPISGPLTPHYLWSLPFYIFFMPSSTSAQSQIFSEFCPGTPFPPNVLTAPGNSHHPTAAITVSVLKISTLAFRDQTFPELQNHIFNCLLDISTWAFQKKF